MKETKKALPDATTEGRIKEAAKKLFTVKGYAATRTRDIAEEAGINLALLNYYFRSKEKLFDLVMMDNVQNFMKHVHAIFNDRETSLDKKITLLVESYIDLLIVNPDMPMFIFNEIRTSPEKFSIELTGDMNIMKSHFIQQFKEGVNRGKISPVHPAHFISNIMALTVFPFIASPMMKKFAGVDHKQFETLMKERKKLIPVWIKAIIKIK